MHMPMKRTNNHTKFPISMNISMNRKLQRIAQWASLTLILLLIDQASKILAVNWLKPKGSVSLIAGIFELYYIENTGAAFGLLSGFSFLLIPFAMAICLICLYVWVKAPYPDTLEEQQYSGEPNQTGNLKQTGDLKQTTNQKKIEDLKQISASKDNTKEAYSTDKRLDYRPLRLVCCMIGAGALGNMIDRLIRGCVIDYFYVSLVDFPVFNIADIYVCVGTALLLILVLTLYRDDNFQWLRR